MNSPAPTLATAPTADEVAAVADPIERAQWLTRIADEYRTLPAPLAALRRQTLLELRATRPVNVVAALLGVSSGRISQLIGKRKGGV